MTLWRMFRFRAPAVATVVGVAAAVAGCGSSSSTGPSVAATSPSPSSAAATSASAQSVAIATARGGAGTYITGASGRAVYLWTADSNGASRCSGACAKVWPPVPAATPPVATGGAVVGDLGKISRSDGMQQLTYKGHPLYYFAEDAHAGTTHGQGSDSFGAKWWLVAPSGSAITSGGASSSATSMSTTTHYGY